MKVSKPNILVLHGAWCTVLELDLCRQVCYRDVSWDLKCTCKLYYIPRSADEMADEIVEQDVLVMQLIIICEHTHTHSFSVQNVYCCSLKTCNSATSK